MNMSSIVNNIVSNYIDENLESAKKINYTELGSKHGLMTALYKELPNTEVSGYPIASDYVAADGTAYSVNSFNALSHEQKKACELRYYFLPNCNELYVGTTSSGKTTGCVEPQLRAVSSQKNKPNLFLTDPKGELFNRNAQHLKDSGYQIFVLNFKDLIRSDKWNPLLELYDTKMKIKSIGSNVIQRDGNVKKGLKLYGSKDAFKNKTYYEYNGMAFPNTATCMKYLRFERDYIDATLDSLVNQLVSTMVPVRNIRDPSWEIGAQDLLKGILLCLLEDAIDENSGFTKDMMNFRTIQQFYLTLRTDVLTGRATLKNHRFLANKTSRTKALLSTALDNAPNTMRSYCGVFDTTLKDWFQGHVFALTIENTIKLDASDKPFAVFLITRDYEKSDFLIAGLFVDWVYRQMLQKAESTDNPRTMHFILDEFANIPKITDLENKIATCRSRNIWFHLFVQSYAQIDNVYEKPCSEIIRDNCNAQIFLGAQNRASREIFSNECGRHNIPTLESKLKAEDNSIREVPLIPVSALDEIKPGEMYIKRLFTPVITSQFIRSYICAEQGTYKDFIDAEGLQTCTPCLVEPFTDPRFTYEKLYENDIDDMDDSDIFDF